MSENRYLNADEARLVNQYADEYIQDPPDFADKITDDLDRIILKSEGIPTLETANALAYTRRVEAEQRVERMGRGASIPDKVLQSVQNDDALADLDSAIWQGFRDNSPLSEDGGESHAAAAYNEIVTAQQKVAKQLSHAKEANKATSRQFGTGFSQEKSVTAEEFYRGKGKR